MRLDKRPQLAGRAEFGDPPGLCAAPAAETPDRGPEAPAAKLADHEPAVRPEHARHLGAGAIRVENEAENGHGDDAVERAVRKGQGLALPLDKITPDRRGHGSRTRRSQHPRVRVEPRHPGPTPGERGCQGAIATAEIEHVEAINRTQQLQGRDVPRARL